MTLLTNDDLFKLCKCDECPLKDAPGPVFGHGNRQMAKLTIVAEAPGRQEAKDGIPMRGPAGKQSDDTLKDAGSDRSEVYVTNTVLCRPMLGD